MLNYLLDRKLTEELGNNFYSCETELSLHINEITNKGVKSVLIIYLNIILIEQSHYTVL